ncbi:MAG: hypothetical protein WC795_02865 [Candidatus Paceibacterota bacterium]|jgi:hypothetical protein
MKRQIIAIIWLSTHRINPEQKKVLQKLYGSDVEIIQDRTRFSTNDGLKDYICKHPDMLVYAVAKVQHYQKAAKAGFQFGVFKETIKGLFPSGIRIKKTSEISFHICIDKVEKKSEKPQACPNKKFSKRQPKMRYAA